MQFRASYHGVVLLNWTATPERVRHAVAEGHAVLANISVEDPTAESKTKAIEQLIAFEIAALLARPPQPEKDRTIQNLLMWWVMTRPEVAVEEVVAGDPEKWNDFSFHVEIGEPYRLTFEPIVETQPDLPFGHNFRVTECMERLIRQLSRIAPDDRIWLKESKRKFIAELAGAEKFIISDQRLYPSLMRYFDLNEFSETSDRFRHLVRPLLRHLFRAPPYPAFVVERHLEVKDPRDDQVIITFVRVVNGVLTARVFVRGQTQEYHAVEAILEFRLSDDGDGFQVGVKGWHHGNTLSNERLTHTGRVTGRYLVLVLWLLSLPDKVLMESRNQRNAHVKGTVISARRYRTIDIAPHARHVGMLGPLGYERKSPEPHLRRGHVRRLRDGRVVPVRPAKIGEGEPAHRLYEL